MYEIERKFLLDALPPQTDAVTPTWIDQGYLAVTDDVEVRVRARAGDHLLTVKGGHGQVRRELTLPITAEQFADLWELTEGRRLRKQRWVVHPDGGTDLEVEIDRFDEPVDDLLIAEVEFDSPEDSKAFAPPAWFGREVTDDARYRNAALAAARPATA